MSDPTRMKFLVVDDFSTMRRIVTASHGQRRKWKLNAVCSSSGRKYAAARCGEASMRLTGQRTITRALTATLP